MMAIREELHGNWHWPTSLSTENLGVLLEISQTDGKLAKKVLRI